MEQHACERAATLFRWQLAAVLFFHTKSASATSQSAVLFSHNKSVPDTSHSQSNRTVIAMGTHIYKREPFIWTIHPLNSRTRAVIIPPNRLIDN